MSSLKSIVTGGGERVRSIASTLAEAITGAIVLANKRTTSESRSTAVSTSRTRLFKEMPNRKDTEYRFKHVRVFGFQ